MIFLFYILRIKLADIANVLTINHFYENVFIVGIEKAQINHQSSYNTYINSQISLKSYIYDIIPDNLSNIKEDFLIWAENIERQVLHHLYSNKENNIASYGCLMDLYQSRINDLKCLQKKLYKENMVELDLVFEKISKILEDNDEHIIKVKKNIEKDFTVEKNVFFKRSDTMLLKEILDKHKIFYDKCLISAKLADYAINGYKFFVLVVKEIQKNAFKNMNVN